MAYYQLPLELLLRELKQNPQYRSLAIIGGAVALALVLALIWVFRKYFTFVLKSLLRNKVRTILSSVAIMVLVFVVVLVWSMLLFVDLVMTEQSKDLKAIVTERYQMPSLMPFAYASDLASAAARPGHPEDARPEDYTTWQFYGGTLDPTKMTRENFVFLIATDPDKIKTMFDDMENLPDELITKMKQNKKGCLLGKDRLQALNKKIGERFTITGLSYKDINLEFEILGQLPEGRNDGGAIMNRAYLNDAVEAYPRSHNNLQHPMALKSLNLFWMKVSDTNTFQAVADQVMNSPLFTAPSVKCETASSGISSFLDAYKDLLWGVRWLLVPAILVTMSLVISNAISISVRERRTEMAVLKVLGYGPGRILALVLGEAVLVGVLSGLISAVATYVLIDVVKGGVSFPIAFFPKFFIWADAIWWGVLFGGLTSLIGSLVPAWSARTVKVSEVFAKVG
jgi:putative ABC transport system permease protein